MLQHCVFIKYKTGTPESHVQIFCEKMLALPKLIPEILDLEIGQDEFHEERSWDLILIMRFESEDTLRTYQKHSEHVAAIQFNNPLVDKVGAIDFNK